MKNAKELREITDAIRIKLLSEAKEELFDNIINSSNKGLSHHYINCHDYYINRSFKLTEDEISIISKELIKLGFNIKREGQNRSITW